MMSLTFGLFTQVSGSGPLGPLVTTALITKQGQHTPGSVFNNTSLAIVLSI